MPIDTETPPQTATPKTITTPKTTLYHTNWGRESTDPRPELNGTLSLNIQVYPYSATIDCREEEHVGEGTNRGVIFLTNEACTLVFSNEDVFGMKEHPLKAGRTDIPIDEQRIAKNEEYKRNNKIWTFCSVKPLDPTKTIPKKFHSPPKIEVP